MPDTTRTSSPRRVSATRFGTRSSAPTRWTSRFPARRRAQVTRAEPRWEQIAVLAASQAIRRLGRIAEDLGDIHTVDPLIPEPTAHRGSDLERFHRRDIDALFTELDITRALTGCG